MCDTAAVDGTFINYYLSLVGERPLQTFGADVSKDVWATNSVRSGCQRHHTRRTEHEGSLLDEPRDARGAADP